MLQSFKVDTSAASGAVVVVDVDASYGVLAQFGGPLITDPHFRIAIENGTLYVDGFDGSQDHLSVGPYVAPGRHKFEIGYGAGVMTAKIDGLPVELSRPANGWATLAIGATSTLYLGDRPDEPTSPPTYMLGTLYGAGVYPK